MSNMLARIFSFKSLILAGISLNVAVFIYVYFIVDGGPPSVKLDGGWMALFNEVPITVLFFLASVFKPYLMVWSKCRKNPVVITTAAAVMLASTAVACLIIILAVQAVTKNIALYINWALLWVVSAYFVLTPQRAESGEQ
jgi:hypothetical protein